MSQSLKTDIRSLSLDQLKEEFEKLGEKPYRAVQVYEWFWKKSVTGFSSMTNLSVSLREKLAEQFVINPVIPAVTQYSSDGTIKAGYRLHDDNIIESVLIPKEKRMTVCISSQVGCSLACKFCATGYLERKRNLDPGEIYDQVVQMDRLAVEKYERPVTNIVFMGMGEPLLNYNNVLKAAEMLTSEDGLNYASKRITLSTAGISKMIRKLADDGVKFKLALSLHAANDEKRKRIMPINESNSLASLAEALQYFYLATKNKITFEYIVFGDFNDSLEDANELYRFTKHVPCKVNIIEYNPIDEAEFRNAAPEKVKQFSDYLQEKGVNVKIRNSRGKDIDAACGQLANRKRAGGSEL
jgi:23S rRNA (adenine2503-C2)-methyltransferase